MNKQSWRKRVLCVALAVLLLLIFCTVGHDCHYDDCPVCLLAASFRLTLGMAVLALGIFSLRWVLCSCAHMQHCTAGKDATLVSLKVKLSD